MCGIVGYVGDKNPIPILISGLHRLEYRGYDSAGVAVLTKEKVFLKRMKGKLSKLEEALKIDNPEMMPESRTRDYSAGIGHTRWATHGVPNEVNAHPHFDCKEKIAVVHNGIIENYKLLKEQLQKEGHRFRSETDTEVVSHLVEKFYDGDLFEAVKKSIKLVKGSFAIAVIHKDEPGRIVAARCDSPLIIGLGKNENFLASDIPAILAHTKNIIYLDNHELIDLTKERVKITDFNGKLISKKPVMINWDISQAEKGGYDHFMLKEIFEQPEIITNIYNERVLGGKVSFEGLSLSDNKLRSIKNIIIVACGTAYHAGLTGKYIIEELTRIPVWVDTSSEFRYRDPIITKDSLVIPISQSGETADTLAALREAKSKGGTVLSICNVLGSSIARESDGVIYTHAGPEIAVASTKAYTAQLAILYLFAIYMANLRKTLNKNKTESLLKEFKKVPKLMKEILNDHRKHNNELARYASSFNKKYHELLQRSELKDRSHSRREPNCFFLFLGRNVNYPNALEGALKLKEISYISAEGYPAGEMKHGPIALIDENPWVVCIATKSSVYDKIISNIQEIKARSGIVVAIVTKNDLEIDKYGINYKIEIPNIHELFSPLLVALPLQLWAYYVAREFGEEIDQPRNLAKSVTVE